MDAFSFLMIKAKLEYYENMSVRMLKEARLRPAGQKRERKTAPDLKAAPVCIQAPILRRPLEEAHE